MSPEGAAARGPRRGVLGPEPGRALPPAPVYGPRPADAPIVNLAFLGRVSDEDLQDPTLSLPRQLGSCQAILPSGARIVAYFWDVESGRIDPDQRGRSDAHTRFAVPIPRDGGIQDLLDAAKRRDGRFDAVICEAIDRVARRTYYGVKIEHDLERCGVPLLAADEGISNLRKRATQILTRRVKQATAEWYVLETLEKAWDGFCQHTTQGWNIGVPPYGYLADRIPHPVPAKRAEGLHKTRLAPDPVRAPVVAQVFAWRISARMSCQDIADRLNADPNLYPPPTAIGGSRSRGSWSARTVFAMLRNPKYTGYMVWNRRARNTNGGHHNPPESWVWSAEQTHPPIVSLDTYRMASQISDGRKGSRSTAKTNRHPKTVRTYVLRSYVHCAICKRRMESTTRKGGRFTYLRCRVRPTAGHDAAHRWPGHPPDLYVSERLVLDGVLDFFADRLFGPERRALLTVSIDEGDRRRHIEWQTRITAAEKTIDDLDARRGRLVRTIETAAELEPELLADINRRAADICREQDAKRNELADMRAHPPETSGRDTGLLDLLGTVTRIDLERTPEPLLRDLFDVCKLQVAYDSRDRQLLCTVTLDEENLKLITAVVDAVRNDNIPQPDGSPTRLGMLGVRSEGLEPPTF